MDPEHTELKCLYIILFDGVQVLEAAAGLSGLARKLHLNYH